MYMYMYRSMYMYIYIYTYTYMYIYTYIDINIWIHIDMSIWKLMSTWCVSVSVYVSVSVSVSMSVFMSLSVSVSMSVSMSLSVTGSRRVHLPESLAREGTQGLCFFFGASALLHTTLCLLFYYCFLKTTSTERTRRTRLYVLTLFLPLYNFITVLFDYFPTLLLYTFLTVRPYFWLRMLCLYI